MYMYNMSHYVHVSIDIYNVCIIIIIVVASQIILHYMHEIQNQLEPLLLTNT